MCGLRSLNPYSIACVSQVASIAAVSSYDAYLASRRNFTTICCETIAFTSSPGAVFNVRSSELASSLSQQVFRFQLLRAPSSSLLIVLPVIRTTTGALVRNSSYQMSPSSLAIASSSSTSQSFLLTMNNASLGGTYFIDLSLFGSASSL